MVSRLQVKATHIGRILNNLERSYDCTPVSSPSTQQPPPMKKPHLRIDPIPPFNASRVRKSPSGLAAVVLPNAQIVETIEVEEQEAAAAKVEASVVAEAATGDDEKKETVVIE